MTFYGADTTELRLQSDRVANGSMRLEELFRELQTTVDNVEWYGPDADVFRADFASESQLVGTRVELLRYRVEEMKEHAAEQDLASRAIEQWAKHHGWSKSRGLSAEEYVRLREKAQKNFPPTWQESLGAWLELWVDDQLTLLGLLFDTVEYEYRHDPQLKNLIRLGKILPWVGALVELPDAYRHLEEGDSGAFYGDLLEIALDFSPLAPAVAISDLIAMGFDMDRSPLEYVGDALNEMPTTRFGQNLGGNIIEALGAEEGSFEYEIASTTLGWLTMPAFAWFPGAQPVSLFIAIYENMTGETLLQW
ncbi:MAG: hypothetical protein ACTIJK_15535 [Brachybacterium sp.]